MLQSIRRRTQHGDEAGASAVEYGLLVAAIAAVIVVVIFALGGVIRDAFQNTCNSVKASTVTTQTC